MTTSDNKWYDEWQRMTTGGSTTSDNEWQRAVQRVTKSDNEWQWATASESSGILMKTAQYTPKNGWLPSFQWHKEIHYYFKGWMPAIIAVK